MPIERLKEAIDELVNHLFSKAKDIPVENNNKANFLPQVLSYQNDTVFVDEIPSVIDLHHAFLTFGSYSYEEKLRYVAIIFDTSFIMANKDQIKKSSNTNQINEALNNLDFSESPSTYPPNLRKEALLATILDVKNISNSTSIMYIYSIDKGFIEYNNEKIIGGLAKSHTGKYLIAFAQGFLNNFIYKEMGGNDINFETFSYEIFKTHLKKALEIYPGLEFINRED